MKLKIIIEVKDKAEAYNLVNEIGFEHEVVEATYDNKTEKFKNNIQKNFLKNK